MDTAFTLQIQFYVNQIQSLESIIKTIIIVIKKIIPSILQFDFDNFHKFLQT